jgi:hypothetical protein
MRISGTIAWFAFALYGKVLLAFQSPSATRFCPTRLLLTKSSDLEQETEDMKELILSLSLEPTDESRRERLAELFGEALAKPNGAPKRFTDLFDKTLIEVGDRVRKEALETLECEQNLPSDGSKSPQELQVWALIDMMVQSKTLVKKANGELGNGGTFA